MPVWFEVGIPQSWGWTLLAPYISSCPENQTRLIWQNFPALSVLNQPNPARINGSDVGFGETIGNTSSAASNSTVPAGDACVSSDVVGEGCAPGITRNRTAPLSFAGRQVFFEWETPGKPVGPNNSYVTATSAGVPKFVVWVNQLNVTYSDLTCTEPTKGYTFQPDTATYQGDPAINGTMFVALTDSDIPYTAFNLSMINPHVVAGPALYQAG